MRRKHSERDTLKSLNVDTDILNFPLMNKRSVGLQFIRFIIPRNRKEYLISIGYFLLFFIFNVFIISFYPNPKLENHRSPKQLFFYCIPKPHFFLYPNRQISTQKNFFIVLPYSENIMPSSICKENTLQKTKEL